MALGDTEQHGEQPGNRASIRSVLIILIKEGVLSPTWSHSSYF